jgi:hypothetical protein
VLAGVVRGVGQGAIDGLGARGARLASLADFVVLRKF